jgi:hypothetical protein
MGNGWPFFTPTQSQQQANSRLTAYGRVKTLQLASIGERVVPNALTKAPFIGLGTSRSTFEWMSPNEFRAIFVVIDFGSSRLSLNSTQRGSRNG